MFSRVAHEKLAASARGLAVHAASTAHESVRVCIVRVCTYSHGVHVVNAQFMSLLVSNVHWRCTCVLLLCNLRMYVCVCLLRMLYRYDVCYKHALACCCKPPSEVASYLEGCGIVGYIQQCQFISRILCDVGYAMQCVVSRQTHASGVGACFKSYEVHMIPLCLLHAAVATVVAVLS
jgi:hypothetical protein